MEKSYYLFFALYGNFRVTPLFAHLFSHIFHFVGPKNDRHTCGMSLLLEHLNQQSGFVNLKVCMMLFILLQFINLFAYNYFFFATSPLMFIVLEHICPKSNEQKPTQVISLQDFSELFKA